MKPKSNNGKDKSKNNPVKRDGYTAKKIGLESAYEGEDEIARRMRRGDESKDDANERDIAGNVDSKQVSPDVSSNKEVDNDEALKQRVTTKQSIVKGGKL